MAVVVRNAIHPELIAPCGLNCAVCSRYLAFVNKIPRTEGVIYCAGCRPGDKHCAMIKKECREILALAEGEVEYCCDCDSYPCNKLAHLDKRYRERYGVSLISNLEEIRTLGLAEFIEVQADRYRCPKCGGLISVHDEKCYKCDKVARLKR